ncbi:MAG: DUF3467 domain-containing protein [Acidimicrobiales bacterium]
MTANQPQAVQFKFEVPDEETNGRYSNMLSVWSSPHEFTLDFAVTGQPAPPEPGDPVVVPARVVARIKIPLALAQDVLQALATQVSQFEESVGQRIPRLEDKQTMYPPEAPQ